MHHVGTIRGADRYECSIIRARPTRKPTKLLLRRSTRRTPRPPCRRPAGANVVATLPSDGDGDGPSSDDDHLATVQNLTTPPPSLEVRGVSLF
jgi:hypothetical protein